MKKDRLPPIEPDQQDLALAQESLENLHSTFVHHLVNQAGEQEWERILGQPARNAISRALEEQLSDPEFTNQVGYALEHAITKIVRDRNDSVFRGLDQTRKEFAQILQQSREHTHEYSKELDQAAVAAVRRVVAGQVRPTPVTKQDKSHNRSHKQKKFEGLMRVGRALWPTHGRAWILVGLALCVLVLATISLLDTRKDLQILRGRIDNFQQTSAAEPSRKAEPSNESQQSDNREVSQ
jgi:hypothetical protein